MTFTQFRSCCEQIYELTQGDPYREPNQLHLTPPSQFELNRTIIDDQTYWRFVTLEAITNFATIRNFVTGSPIAIVTCRDSGDYFIRVDAA